MKLENNQIFMSKILITPSSFGQCGQEPLKILEEKGYDYLNNPYGRRLSEEETIELAKDAKGIVAGVENYNKDVLDKLDNLECISRVGVGMESIDLEYAEKKGVKVVNTPNGPTPAVAELSLALCFDLLRQISFADRSIRAGEWNKYVGRLIDNKVVGIVGLGRIGKATAKKYQAVGCEVIAYDLYPDIEWMENNNVKNKGFEEVLTQSDIISIHVSSNPDKGALIGNNELSLLPSEAILINLARGGVIDEKDLYEYLKINSDSYAALDVFENEPYEGPLQKLENVLLTPHLGSYAREAKLGMEIQAVNNLLKEIN